MNDDTAETGATQDADIARAREIALRLSSAAQSLVLNGVSEPVSGGGSEFGELPRSHWLRLLKAELTGAAAEAHGDDQEFREKCAAEDYEQHGLGPSDSENVPEWADRIRALPDDEITDDDPETPAEDCDCDDASVDPSELG